jgi:Phytanoyl-CoA dioxygenase (PhyH)
MGLDGRLAQRQFRGEFGVAQAAGKKPQYLKVVPGSHLTNWIDGPPRRDIRWPDPDGVIEVTAGPGDAVFFDRRIWHTRSRNHSRAHPQGGVLRLHLPVDHHPTPTTELPRC